MNFAEALEAVDRNQEKLQNGSKYMRFPEALKVLFSGKYVRRLNSHIHKVYMVDQSVFNVNREPLIKILGEGTKVQYMPHLDCIYDNGTVGVYTPTQEDIFASDWIVIE